MSWGIKEWMSWGIKEWVGVSMDERAVCWMVGWFTRWMDGSMDECFCWMVGCGRIGMI